MWHDATLRASAKLFSSESIWGCFRNQRSLTLIQKFFTFLCLVPLVSVSFSLLFSLRIGFLFSFYALSWVTILFFLVETVFRSWFSEFFLLFLSSYPYRIIIVATMATGAAEAPVSFLCHNCLDPCHHDLWTRFFWSSVVLISMSETYLHVSPSTCSRKSSLLPVLFSTLRLSQIVIINMGV